MSPKLIERVLNIDSMFRKNALTVPSTDMQIQLPTTVNNVIKMETNQIEIPNTYYNISSELGNAMFVINDGSATPKKIRIPDGRYQITFDDERGRSSKLAMDIEVAINNAMHTANISKNFVFTIDKTTRKGVFATKREGNIQEMTIFFNVDANGNIDETSITTGGLRTKLGWLLGFRTGTYHMKSPTGANAVAIASEDSAYLPLARYIYLVIDDFCNESYDNFISVFHDSLNTKNVLSRIDLGDPVDHTKWTTTGRIYQGPVNISKLRVTLTDELGRVVNLNGADWSVALKVTCVVDR